MTTPSVEVVVRQNRGGPLWIARRRLADASILSLLLMLAFAHHLGRHGGAYPFPSAPALDGFAYLDGDAANIASFAAGLDHPELFGGDEVLSDRRRFRIYSTVHIPTIRALERLTGDYGTAFVSLLGIHVFLQAVGFYLLGLVLFRSRYWGTLLAILTLMPVQINLGEYWGIYEDPQPRFSFQALLPFVLAAAFYWRSNPAAWPWLMAAAGVLVYVHPVSAPAWGLAIWSGFWACQPPAWSLKKRAGCMLGLGVLFVLVAAPFLRHYLQNFAHGAPQAGAAYDKVIEILTFRYDEGFLDLPAALDDFIGLFRDQWFYWAWAAAGAALMLMWQWENRRSVALVLLWSAGLLLATVVVPLADHTVSRALGRFPLQLDLIRGIRYTIPLMLLFCLWPLARVFAATRLGGGPKMVARAGAYSMGLLLTVLWIEWYPPTIVAHTLSCWGQRKLVCEWPEPEWGWWPNVSHLAEALNAVRRHTPPGSTILSTSSDYALHIRYYARRPVVFSWKDGGILGYSSHDELLKWYDRHVRLKAVMAEKEPHTRLRDLLRLSMDLGASYLLIDISADPELRFTADPHLVDARGAKALWGNSSFTLLKIDETPGQAGSTPSDPRARGDRVRDSGTAAPHVKS